MPRLVRPRASAILPRTSELPRPPPKGGGDQQAARGRSTHSGDVALSQLRPIEEVQEAVALRKLIASVRRRLADEQGVALVVGIGVSVVLGIAGTTAMDYTTSNLHMAHRSSADQAAFALAEAGLGNATSVLGNTANNVFDANLLPQRLTTYTT